MLAKKTTISACRKLVLFVDDLSSSLYNCFSSSKVVVRLQRLRHLLAPTSRSSVGENLKIDPLEHQNNFECDKTLRQKKKLHLCNEFFFFFLKLLSSNTKAFFKVVYHQTLLSWSNKHFPWESWWNNLSDTYYHYYYSFSSAYNRGRIYNNAMPANLLLDFGDFSCLDGWEYILLFSSCTDIKLFVVEKVSFQTWLKAQFVQKMEAILPVLHWSPDVEMWVSELIFSQNWNNRVEWPESNTAFLFYKRVSYFYLIPFRGHALSSEK